MSFSDKPSAPRAPRKARARISLKMQAIGFLSRREHSRQELRAKLLDSLRKRAREEAATAVAAEKAAQALAEALREQPSNGIDDAFAPPLPAPVPAPLVTRAARARASAQDKREPASHAHDDARAGARPKSAHNTALDRSAIETLSLANGAPLPAALRASLASATLQRQEPAPTQGPAAMPSPSPAPLAATRRALAPESFNEFIDVDGERLELSSDDLPAQPMATFDATDVELADPEAAVDKLLDWLVLNKYLSETRFVESRINARSRKQGTLLIKLELSRHGLALEPEQAATLRETEFARALALWQRKFGEVAPDARLRSKQARFLAARGFAADVVRRVVGGEEEF